jgi:hypothetical protein
MILLVGIIALYELKKRQQQLYRDSSTSAYSHYYGWEWKMGKITTSSSLKRTSKRSSNGKENCKALCKTWR